MNQHSGTTTVQFFEGNSFVGSRRVYCCGYEGQSAYWPHTAYFCPVCGELWGRAIYQHEFDYKPIPQNSWVIETRRCVKHGDGTFLQDSQIDHCDRAILTRELLALIENWKPNDY
jgi:hypothetical protein